MEGGTHMMIIGRLRINRIRAFLTVDEMHYYFYHFPSDTVYTTNLHALLLVSNQAEGSTCAIS